MSYKIKKNVPIPAPKTKGGVYPWKEMRAGDSITVPMAKRTSAASAGALWFKKHRASLTVQTSAISDTEVGIWVVETTKARTR